MKDVANLAGVSAQTVSRVLSGKGYVSEQTRAKVQQAVSQLGYRPNIAASSLASGKSQLVGVLIVGELSYGRALAYIRFEQLQSKKCHFVVSSSAEPTESAELRESLDFLQSIHPQALVIISQNQAAVNLLLPHLSQPAVIAMNHPVPSSEVGRVELEQVDSTTALLTHLYERGCRRIAHLSPDIDEVDAIVRKNTYIDFCQKNSLAPLIIPVRDWSAKAGFAAAHALAKGAFDAIFAANDYLALGAAECLEDNENLLPGRDYALAGFDDLEASVYSRGGLTTVRQKFPELATAIDSQIVDQLAGRPPAVVKIENELIVRGSSANFSRH